MKFVRVENAGGLAKVTLMRPEVRNAFQPEMIRELKVCFQDLAMDSNLRVVVLQGEGKAFCAGADLAYMQEMVKFDFQQNLKDAKDLFDLYFTLMNCPVPLISVAHGAVYGGGLGLLAVSDVVLATESCVFCFSEVKLGIAPAVISPFVLRKMSAGAVRAHFLSGRSFSSDQARLGGLVDVVVEDEGIADLTDAYISDFLRVGPGAVRATKKLLVGLEGIDWAQAKDHTTEAIARLRVSAEGQEGLLSFLQKRHPSWSPPK